MLARAPTPYTEAEYLIFEAENPEKAEFVNGEILAIAGVSYAHSTIQMNLGTALKLRLRGKRCQPHGPDLRVHTAETGLYAYPDLVVVCGEPELTATNPPSLLNPRVLIEILSESTVGHDRMVKVAHYRRRASVEAIVLVDSRRRLIELQTRNPNGTWTLDERVVGDLPLQVLDLAIPLDEIYEGVAFPAPAAPIARRRRSPSRAR